MVGQGVTGGVWAGRGRGIIGVLEMEEESAESRNSKRAGSGPTLQNTDFCCFLMLRIF